MYRFFMPGWYTDPPSLSLDKGSFQLNSYPQEGNTDYGDFLIEMPLAGATSKGHLDE